MTLPLRHFFPFDLGVTAMGVTQAALDPQLAPAEVQAQIISLLSQNQGFEQMMQQVDVIKGRGSQWGQGEAKEGEGISREPIDKIVGLLGRSVVRNLVLCIRMNRVFKKGIPLKPDEALETKPRDQIKVSIALEEFCQDNFVAFSENAFRAGLHWDWLWAYINSDPKIPKEIHVLYEETLKDSLQVAQVAYGLSGLSKQFPMQQYSFAGGLLLNIGKVIQAIDAGKDGKKPWKEFIDSISKMEGQRDLAWKLLEPKNYSASHAQLGSCLVSFFKILRPLEKAICFYQEPYFLKGLDPDLYKLSAMLNLAQRCFESHVYSKDKPLSAAYKKYFDDLGINEKQVPLVFKKLKPLSIK
jgi:hypothetical protein